MRIAGTKPQLSQPSLKEDYANKLPILVEPITSTEQWHQLVIHDLRRRQQRSRHLSFHWSSAPFILLWDEIEHEWHNTYEGDDF